MRKFMILLWWWTEVKKLKIQNFNSIIIIKCLNEWEFSIRLLVKWKKNQRDDENEVILMIFSTTFQIKNIIITRDHSSRNFKTLLFVIIIYNQRFSLSRKNKFINWNWKISSVRFLRHVWEVSTHYLFSLPN